MLKHLTKRFLFCCVCINATCFPEEQNNERQREKSTNGASYGNRQEIKHFIFQEDKSNLELNQGQLSIYHTEPQLFFHG